MFQKGKHYKSIESGIIYKCIFAGKEIATFEVVKSVPEYSQYHVGKECVVNHNRFMEFVEYQPPQKLERWITITKSEKGLDIGSIHHWEADALSLKKFRQIHPDTGNQIIDIVKFEFEEPTT